MTFSSKYLQKQGPLLILLGPSNAISPCPPPLQTASSGSGGPAEVHGNPIPPAKGRHTVDYHPTPCPAEKQQLTAPSSLLGAGPQLERLGARPGGTRGGCDHPTSRARLSGPWRRKGWRVPGAARPACPPPCLPSGKLGPPRLHWVSFSSRETIGREPQAEPGERAAVATSGRGLAEPRAPRATAASLGAAADKRPPPAGTPGTCRPQTHSPESRGGRGGQGRGSLGSGLKFQKSHHGRTQTATSEAPRAGSSPLQTPVFLHEVPDASVLGMVIVTLRCQTPRPGRGLHTCDRPFVPTHLGHPPAQTDRCGWLRVGVSGISDQEI